MSSGLAWESATHSVTVKIYPVNHFKLIEWMDDSASTAAEGKRFQITWKCDGLMKKLCVGFPENSTILNSTRLYSVDFTLFTSAVGSAALQFDPHTFNPDTQKEPVVLTLIDNS